MSSLAVRSNSDAPGAGLIKELLHQGFQVELGEDSEWSPTLENSWENAIRQWHDTRNVPAQQGTSCQFWFGVLSVLVLKPPRSKCCVEDVL